MKGPREQAREMALAIIGRCHQTTADGQSVACVDCIAAALDEAPSGPGASVAPSSEAPDGDGRASSALVLKPWVWSLPWRRQSTLFSALRGPDVTERAEDVQNVVRWIRGVVQKDACEADGIAHLCTYMRHEDAVPAAPTSAMPEHFRHHIVAALRVIADSHPSASVSRTAQRLTAALTSHQPGSTPVAPPAPPGGASGADGASLEVPQAVEFIRTILATRDRLRHEAENLSWMLSQTWVARLVATHQCAPAPPPDPATREEA